MSYSSRADHLRGFLASACLASKARRWATKIRHRASRSSNVSSFSIPWRVVDYRLAPIVIEVDVYLLQLGGNFERGQIAWGFFCGRPGRLGKVQGSGKNSLAFPFGTESRLE